VRLLNHVCYGKAIRITYSDCMPIVLFVQHENRMHSIMLSPVVSMDLPHFSILSHKSHNIREKRY